MKREWYKYGMLLLTIAILASGCGSKSKNEANNQTEASTQQSTQDVGTEVTTETTVEEVTESTQVQTEVVTEEQATETESQVASESEAVVEDNKNNSQQNNSNNNNNNNNNSNNNQTQTWEEWMGDTVFIEETASDDSQLPIVKDIVKKIIKNDMTELEKAKAIHDYMVINIDYDAKNYVANTIPSESYTAEGALKSKYAVCSGYAKAFQALCKASGLECEYVRGTGNSGAHAWNQVKIDGTWYNVDVTWDDPIKLDGETFDNHIHNRYDYFLISDEILYRDHKAENAKHTCNKSLHLEVLRLGIPWAGYKFVENQEQFDAAVEDMIKKNSNCFIVMLPESFIPRFEGTNYLKEAMERLQVVRDYQITGSSVYSADGFGIYRTMMYLELENGKYTRFTVKKTQDEVKKEIVRLVKENGPEGRYDIYMPIELLEKEPDYFKKYIERWAFYEQNLIVKDIGGSAPYNDVRAVDLEVRKRTKEDSYQEIAYSYKELEGYIKEMIKRNDSSMSAQLNYENLELEGEFSVDFEIEKILQKKFGEKYGLTFAATTNNAYDNFVVVYIRRVEPSEST